MHLGHSSLPRLISLPFENVPRGIKHVILRNRTKWLQSDSHDPGFLWTTNVNIFNKTRHTQRKCKWLRKRENKQCGLFPKINITKRHSTLYVMCDLCGQTIKYLGQLLLICGIFPFMSMYYQNYTILKTDFTVLALCKDRTKNKMSKKEHIHVQTLQLGHHAPLKRSWSSAPLTLPFLFDDHAHLVRSLFLFLPIFSAVHGL